MFEVKFKKLHVNAVIPSYKYYSDSGFDLSACEDFLIEYGKVSSIRTGLAIELPELNNSIFSLELQIRPRSGLAKKIGLTVVNSPGTIDFTYRGEILFLMTILDKNKSIQGNVGDKIAQGIICPVFCRKVKIVESFELSDTKRNSNGFGSTGV